jgi:hypothetical protein
MKVALCAPYGSLHKESGLLFLVANYLAKSGSDLVQLRCDGAVPACGRDRGAGVERSPFQCARCIGDQGSFASWAGASVRELSHEILPEDVMTAATWIQGVASGALERVEFRGVNLLSACRSELAMRWEALDFAALTEVQELDVRALFLSYVRMAVASERFLSRTRPNLALVSSIRDPLSHAFVLQAKQAQVDTVVGWYKAESQTVGLESLATRQSYSTSIVIEGLTTMRSDPRTWGPEITAMVHEALTFLGCAPDRLK